jgi:hypothetical protein
MAELSIQDRLRSAQAKVKALNSTREQIIGDARVEEQKLKQAYSNLKELGIEGPENLTIKELRALEISSKAELEEKLLAIETQLAKGEELIQKYNSLQETA